MSSYLLFFPDKKGASPDLLRNVGLGSTLREGAPAFAEILSQANPTKKQGMLCGWENTKMPVSRRGMLEFDDTTQNWFPCAVDKQSGVSQGDFWVGMPATGLAPESLQYADCKPSVLIEFLDGNTWKLPRAHAMPRTLHIDRKTGGLVYQTRDQFESFCKRAAVVGEAILDGFARIADQSEFEALVTGEDDQPASVEIELVDAMELVTDGLAINYRVHWQVLNCIDEFFDDRLLIGAAMGICDYDGIIDVTMGQKKSAAGESVEVHIGQTT